MTKRFLRREDVPSYVRDHWGMKIATQTLARMAVDGSGPIFQKNGRTVLYTEAALDEWAEGRLSKPVRSTSELQTAARAA